MLDTSDSYRLTLFKIVGLVLSALYGYIYIGLVLHGFIYDQYHIEWFRCPVASAPYIILIYKNASGCCCLTSLILEKVIQS